MESVDSATTAYVALGANEGDRLAQLRDAVRQLDAQSAITVEAASPVYTAEAHTLTLDDTAPEYLNAVLQLHTTLAPKALLHACQQIERAAGRDRSDSAGRWAPRPLDIDLLTYGRHTQDTPDLTVPHPRLGERRFVLQPWCDIAPNLYVPPPFDAPVQTLLARCTDTAALHRTPHRLLASAS